MQDPQLQPPPLPPTQPQPLPYAIPVGAAYAATAYGPPASIKAIGITGVILGGLALLNHVGGIVLFVAVPATTAHYGDTYRAFQIANSIAFGTAALVLIAGSIGCLMRAEWGRRVLLVWATIYPALLLFETGLLVGWMIPTYMAPRATTPQQQMAITGAYIGAVVAAVLMLVLPICIHAFLRRPYVRAAFGR